MGPRTKRPMFSEPKAGVGAASDQHSTCCSEGRRVLSANLEGLGTGPPHLQLHDCALGYMPWESGALHLHIWL